MSTLKEDTGSYFSKVTPFPSVVDGRIDTAQFLTAAVDLVSVVERISKVFAPVRYDMLGNIEKVRKYYEADKINNSCIIQLLENESRSDTGHHTAEGILWLNRAILFFELVFQQIISYLKINAENVSMKKIFTFAYEGSVKRYHNWATQQLFNFVCKMTPTFPQILKSFEADLDLKAFETTIETFNDRLHLVRSKIDDYFKEKDLFQES